MTQPNRHGASFLTMSVGATSGYSNNHQYTQQQRRVLVKVAPRLCCRPTCSLLASAVLSYDYSARLIWVDNLPAEEQFSTYELCEKHAKVTRPPQGWTLADRRPDQQPLFTVSLSR